MVRAGFTVVAGMGLAVLIDLVPAPAQAEQRSFSIFAGILTDNTWEDYFITPWETDPQDPGLLGIAFTQPLGRGFDTRSRNAEAIAHRLLHGLAPQDILLLHDGHAARDAHGAPVLLAVLPKMLEAAARAQLQWTTLRAALPAQPAQTTRPQMTI